MFGFGARREDGLADAPPAGRSESAPRAAAVTWGPTSACVRRRRERAAREHAASGAAAVGRGAAPRAKRPPRRRAPASEGRCPGAAALVRPTSRPDDAPARLDLRLCEALAHVPALDRAPRD